MSLSVLILSFNHAPYIGEAIASVVRQLDYVDQIELLILDDGSTDGTQDILRSLRLPAEISLRLFLNEHKGVEAIAGNFNFLIANATGTYICFLASDDYFPAQAFKHQIDYLEQHQEAQLVYGNGVNFSGDQLQGRLHVDKIQQALASSDARQVEAAITSTVPQLYIQALLVRRSFFDGFAPFDESLIADDWAFNIRVFRRLRMEGLAFHFWDGITFHRRLLSSSTSNNLRVHYHRILQVARKYVPADNKAFFAYFYLRYAKTFVRQRMPRHVLSMFWRLLLLRIGCKCHSRGLEQLL
ncbi:glycosyltransferase [Paucibacter sp. XJ19-41]|uniref:glycosyltransferase n=1 Tax=Paucibacter sp. XJ19-41 TaxID=2927824 RepID=UPI002348F06F|nr:glycosyltransferase [Paucibacter sp. XJ19-41]MDC6166174.1 glycosyltransferase [Paucibacter sp. XJ19-41]